jgi:hypothetical protein
MGERTLPQESQRRKMKIPRVGAGTVGRGGRLLKPVGIHALHMDPPPLLFFSHTLQGGVPNE